MHNFEIIGEITSNGETTYFLQCKNCKTLRTGKQGVTSTDCSIKVDCSGYCHQAKDGETFGCGCPCCK